jgi:hypothetical protein
MVIREQRNPANGRTLYILERFCMSDGHRKTGPAAGVCCCERERARTSEIERENGGREREIESTLSQTPCMVSTATKFPVDNKLWLRHSRWRHKPKTK